MKTFKLFGHSCRVYDDAYADIVACSNEMIEAMLSFDRMLALRKSDQLWSLLLDNTYGDKRAKRMIGFIYSIKVRLFHGGMEK